MPALRKIALFVLVTSPVLLTLQCADKPVDFSAEVKPILNKRCISCHGGVKKNGGFSVLFREEAIDTTESGKPSIVPGHSELSEVIRRITSNDPEVRMPYKEEPLTKQEIDILTRWIDQGAAWGEHWAYQPLKPVHVPTTSTLLSSSGNSEGEWAQNDIDRFILDRLEKEQLKPSPTTDKATLVRRVYLDLIGLPPTPEQAKQFIDDDSPAAYEKVVNELLASPHFGEKWASWWLDLARYSDTKGYERDVSRTIWRYRDWVIKAFNADMPYDQFTIEQLAGDLLDHPTDDQLIATAFHRNTMNNDEGGTQDEEFRVAALLDRVNTTWEVWQSTTFGCIQCHSHPYDPFRHEDYYRSMAFFNNARDEDTEGEHPNLRTYKEADQKKLESIREWIEQNGDAKVEQEVTMFLKTLEPKYHPHDFDAFQNSELIDTKWLGVRPQGSARLKQINLTNKTYLFISYWADTPGGTLQIRRDKLDGEVIAQTKIPKTSGRITVPIALIPSAGKHDLYFILDNPSLRAKNQSVCGIEWFAFREDLPGKTKEGYAAVRNSFVQLLNASVDNTPITIENNDEQKRTSYVFERGNWLVKGETVLPGTPATLNTFPKNSPVNRLGFAQWLTSPENPLTARTIVNRFWEQIFGQGLVETLEDFGTQGTPPSHPELLDWLAMQMMTDYHWSMKKLLKEIVMSATYRQDSRVTTEALAKDPSNRWLGRGARVRLSAEQVRDQALTVSGLLSEKMYGPSVMPYQPDGIWNSVWNGEYWKKSTGEDQFRRGLYTFIKRTSPYPAMMMFDGSSREVCVSRRIRTNTPLQALVTLNDSTFFVASKELASHMMQSGATSSEQIKDGYSRVLFHEISAEKLKVMSDFYEQTLAEYKKDGDSVQKVTNDKNGKPEQAAMVLVANALLNLDETITKE